VQGKGARGCPCGATPKKVTKVKSEKDSAMLPGAEKERGKMQSKIDGRESVKRFGRSIAVNTSGVTGGKENVVRGPTVVVSKEGAGKLTAG